MDKNLKILGGSSLPLPENDDPETNIDLEASLEYDALELTDSIGTSEFKETYLNVINNLKAMPIVDQRRVCLKLLDKIKELYEYEIIPKPELEHQLNMNDVYDFIKFLEYDHIEYFADIWRYLKTDLKTIDIEKFGKASSDRIVAEIEDQLESHDYNELISQFLRTYYKYNLIDWFVRCSEKNRMLIYLRILEDS